MALAGRPAPAGRAWRHGRPPSGAATRDRPTRPPASCPRASTVAAGAGPRGRSARPPPCTRRPGRSAPRNTRRRCCRGRARPGPQIVSYSCSARWSMPASTSSVVGTSKAMWFSDTCGARGDGHRVVVGVAPEEEHVRQLVEESEPEHIGQQLAVGVGLRRVDDDVADLRRADRRLVRCWRSCLDVSRQLDRPSIDVGDAEAVAAPRSIQVGRWAQQRDTSPRLNVTSGRVDAVPVGKREADRADTRCARRMDGEDVVLVAAAARST